MDLRDHVSFGSAASAPYNLLSNFSLLESGLALTHANADSALFSICPGLEAWLVTEESFHFATSEAVWQALKARNLATFRRFTASGDLGKLSTQFFQRLYPKKPDEAGKKFASWTKKGNHGIVPKMASNATHAKKLGLAAEDMAFEREHLASAVEAKAWTCLLRLKFSQNPKHAAVLTQTGARYLLERDNRATAATHWGGKLVNGHLTGENAMGRYLMDVRRALC